jgi:hypothetical protein
MHALDNNPGVLLAALERANEAIQAAEQRMCSRRSIGYKVPEVRVPLVVSVGSP